MRRHEDWWEYIKRIIRSYPELNKKGNDLTDKEQRRYDAMQFAIEETRRMNLGEHRIELIDRVYWKRSHTLFGAAMCVPVSERTAHSWNSEFIRLVEKYLDLP